MERVPRLLLVTPLRPDPSLLARVMPAFASVVDAVLLRFPGLSTRELTDLARGLASRSPRPPLLVSDRLDVARAAGVEGVHLRDGGLPPHRVRSHASGLIVGVSRHDSAGLAESAAADYATVSPVFSTASKPGARPLSLSGLAALCGGSPVPVLALGGIEPARVRACLQAGAFGVAVLSAVWDAADPVRAARSIREAIEKTSTSG